MWNKKRFTVENLVFVLGNHIQMSTLKSLRHKKMIDGIKVNKTLYTVMFFTLIDTLGKY